MLDVDVGNERAARGMMQRLVTRSRSTTATTAAGMACALAAEGARIAAAKAAETSKVFIRMMFLR
jgi:hypothetical protein